MPAKSRIPTGVSHSALPLLVEMKRLQELAHRLGEETRRRLEGLLASQMPPSVEAELRGGRRSRQA